MDDGKEIDTNIWNTVKRVDIKLSTTSPENMNPTFMQKRNDKLCLKSLHTIFTTMTNHSGKNYHCKYQKVNKSPD